MAAWSVSLPSSALVRLVSRRRMARPRPRRPLLGGAFDAGTLDPLRFPPFSISTSIAPAPPSRVNGQRGAVRIEFYLGARWFTDRETIRLRAAPPGPYSRGRRSGDALQQKSKLPPDGKETLSAARLQRAAAIKIRERGPRLGMRWPAVGDAGWGRSGAIARVLAALGLEVARPYHIEGRKPFKINEFRDTPRRVKRTMPWCDGSAP